MFDFDFCNALPVQARVGSGTITAIYYYYYYDDDDYYYYYYYYYLMGKMCTFGKYCLLASVINKPSFRKRFLRSPTQCFYARQQELL